MTGIFVMFRELMTLIALSVEDRILKINEKLGELMISESC
jgi:hypothetical protein